MPFKSHLISLDAAKSNANYLFEGEFRRRPSQNLSGASRSVARGQLLQEAAEQRRNREDSRKKENSSIKIQSFYRGYRCRKILAERLRKEFDSLSVQWLGNNQVGFDKLDERKFSSLSKGLILFYDRQHDTQRLTCLINLMMQCHNVVKISKNADSKIWLYRLSKLLSLSLTLFDTECRLDCLKFLDTFTRSDILTDESENSYVWSILIKKRIYQNLRSLYPEKGNEENVMSSSMSHELAFKLVRRSLDTNPSRKIWRDLDTTPVYYFFQHLLSHPLPCGVDAMFNELLELEPQQLMPRNILESFSRSLKEIINSLGQPNQINFHNSGPANLGVKGCKSITWLCVLFIKSLYDRLDALDEVERVTYIKIISELIEPALYISSISQVMAANYDFGNDGQNDSSDDCMSSLPDNHIGPNQAIYYNEEIHNLTRQIIQLLNRPEHIACLKSVIYKEYLQNQLQESLVRICNMMLMQFVVVSSHPLLVQLVLCREFITHLWRSILTVASSPYYGASIPVYIQITRASQMINQSSWRCILPRLRLFCLLCYYMISLISDDELYQASDKNSIYHTSDRAQTGRTDTSLYPQLSITSFYADKLVGISGTLKDICVGLIEIICNNIRQALSEAYREPIRQTLTSRDSQFRIADEAGRLTNLDMKLCFQAVVKLVRQLHARDSRKQFCPDGHWICPSIVIPAELANDFQLITSKQGRLIKHLTRDNHAVDRLTNTTTDIKSVLILQEIPFVIPFEDRVKIFHQLLRTDRQMNQSDGYHYGLPGTAVHLRIRRNYIYEDAFEEMSVENKPNMKLPLKVSLINAAGVDEAGIDGGGLTKEFLSELLKAGFDPMRGLFKYTNDHFLYPNPSAKVLFSNARGGFQVHYEFLGRMLGKAIFEKIMVELPMASFFLAKIIASEDFSSKDVNSLESLDPVLHKNLIYLKNYDGDVADLNLDFTISNNDLGEHEVVELKPGGSKISVTEDNKIEYAILVADYRLNRQIRSHCAAFKEGLAQLVNPDWLQLFDPRELQILISGAPTAIDITDWRRHTNYCSGYTDSSPAINAFWSAVARMNEDSRRNLLKFVTSCSLPPLLGFKELVPQFAIAPSEEERLPTASTCMNLLKLPQIEDVETMLSKLSYAIESNSGFELS